MMKELRALYDPNKRVFHADSFDDSYLVTLCDTSLLRVAACSIEEAAALGKPLCAKCARILHKAHDNAHRIMAAAGEWDAEERGE